MTANCNIPKPYKLYAKNNESIYELEKWVYTIASGKKATVHITRVYWSGAFLMDLTLDECNVLVNNNNEIILNEYGFCDVYKLDEECDRYVNILNTDHYTEGEIIEIIQSGYDSDSDDDSDDSDDDESNMFNIEVMEENGWILEDTAYSICDGCIIEPFFCKTSLQE